MARSVDPEAHRLRRAEILDAAYRKIAQEGYDRTTTAAICREAGISSGTFFHYFPAKLDVLVGILASGTESTRRQFAEIEATRRGLPALLDYVRDLEAEMADEHYGGFVHAVSGVSQLPAIAAALSAEMELTGAFLRDRLAEASADGDLRGDASVGSLARWTQWLIDGAAEGAVDATLPPGELARALLALVRSR
jgi:AcrR family transcriptional regulator